MNNSTLSTPAVPDIHPANNLGLQERILLMQLSGPQPRLDYPTEKVPMVNGCMAERYIIPDKDRQSVLEQLYPFQTVPTMDAVLLDLHTDSTFTVKDFLAIREGDLNFLAAPRYAEAGGTVLDWLPLSDETDEEETSDGMTVSTQTIKGSGSTASVIRTRKAQ